MMCSCCCLAPQLNETWDIDANRADNSIAMVDRVYKYNVFQGLRQPVGLNKTVVAKVCPSNCPC